MNLGTESFTMIDVKAPIMVSNNTKENHMCLNRFLRKFLGLFDRRYGYARIIDNTEKHHRAKCKYYHILVDLEDGDSADLMLTENEFVHCVNRALKNPEDVPHN